LEEVEKLNPVPSSSEPSSRPDPLISTNQISSIEWIFDPIIRVDANFDPNGNLLQSNSLLLSTLDCIQDGVSILDTDLNLRYVNTSIKYWYSISGNYVGQKCHQLYHNQQEPCENCPILNTLKDKAPHIGIVRYSSAGVDKGWQQLFSIPILDMDSNLVGILEYVRDISYQYQLELDLNQIMEQYQSLENRNLAISQLLTERKQEREQLEETISQNIEKFVKPSLNYLKTKSGAADVNLVEKLIEEIVYPITKKRFSILDKLTTKEMQVTRLIKEGKTTAEIARILVVSPKTIDFHRANIRKKLGLNSDSGEYTSLAAFLNSQT
jgi:DNA-binding CsgD family transcriptional regulator